MPRLRHHGTSRKTLSSTQDLLHRFSFGEFINQLVHVADLAHERLFDLFNSYTADNTRD